MQRVVELSVPLPCVWQQHKLKWIEGIDYLLYVGYRLVSFAWQFVCVQFVQDVVQRFNILLCHIQVEINVAVECLYVIMVLDMQFCTQQQIHPDCLSSQVCILVDGVVVGEAYQERFVTVVFLNLPHQRRNIIVRRTVVRIGIGVDM